ncbi:longitudinals lacking protein, isoforms H/M/V-like isoform X4 [Homarus americanus]|uniref:longitudinals lacking protein, isoforms H/M/V-like isoform X4 n=1 Tax=Homarus americanus TaxID=6706 RepID=UPI001C43AB1A|nr:longitudinals lacking protein, isoforms H/M/V-like isoform X4 [Homarus americanus]
MGDGMLSLSWNNHRATFCHILSTLREKERYTDVTVACEGKFYPVHKLVLSTCSEYFEKIFENTPCKHPVIVLKDVQTDELEALLSYMYEGAVSVAQNDLARLIKAAEVLRIKGLAVPDEPPIAETSSKRPTQSRNVSDDRSSPHPKRRRREESSASLQGTAQTSATPPTSPRVSPFSNEHETQHTVPRTQSDTRWMDQRSSEREEQSTEHILDDRQADQTSTTRSSPTPPQVEVMVDETLVKEEMVDHVDNNQDDVIDSGMDYGSMGSDSRLDGSGGGEDDPASHMLPNKFEQKVNPSQGQSQLPEAVVEALAGPSGMQGWLSGCEMPAGFSGLEGYSGGDGSQQDVHPPPQGPPGTQPQAHQLVGLENDGHRTATTDVPRASQVERETNCQWTDERRTSGEWQGLTPASKVHQCPHCAYNTASIQTLKRHVFRHTGEKPFSCPYCTYNTTRKALLKEHINTHTGERPFSCPYCSYNSSHKSILKAHIRTHTGEKPYACLFCPYRATQKSSLNTHLLKHKLDNQSV